MSSIEVLKTIIEADREQERRDNKRRLEDEEELDSLRRILNAEEEADRIAIETAEWRDGLRARVDASKSVLREQSRQSTRAAIAKADKAEVQRAEAKIADLNAATEKKRRILETRFEQLHDEYVERIFKLVINCGDE